MTIRKTLADIKSFWQQNNTQAENTPSKNTPRKPPSVQGLPSGSSQGTPAGFCTMSKCNKTQRWVDGKKEEDSVPPLPPTCKFLGQWH